jgi:hypothetical protein
MEWSDERTSVAGRLAHNGVRVKGKRLPKKIPSMMQTGAPAPATENNYSTLASSSFAGWNALTELVDHTAVCATKRMNGTDEKTTPPPQRVALPPELLPTSSTRNNRRTRTNCGYHFLDT